VQLSHDDFGRRDTLLGMNIRRNPAPVVRDLRRAIRVKYNFHPRSMPRQSLIDRVVHDLIDHVMKTGPIIRIPNIHPRPLPYCI
jgi:hypothetical protein